MWGQMSTLFCFIFYTVLHTYILAPWSRDLHEKLTGSQLVKKFPHFMETRFRSSIHKCLPLVPMLSPYQWINPGLRHQFIFHNMICFYSEELFATHPTPKLEYRPLPTVRDCLFNISAATIHIGGHSSICKLRMCNAVVTGSHLYWLYCLYV